MVTIQGLLQDCRSNSINSGHFLGVLMHATAWAQTGECALNRYTCLSQLYPKITKTRVKIYIPAALFLINV